jgi:Tol biopolymer transport system component
MRCHVPILLSAVAGLVACAPTEPTVLDGLVVVSVVTQGTDLPTDPYRVGVDDAAGRTIAANSVNTLSGVTPGTRTIVLTEVPRNCSAADGTSRTIEVPAGGTERVTFTVSCTPASANLTIQVDPIGTPSPGAAYTFALDDGQVLVIPPGQSATAVVGHIGARYIGLAELPRNCHGPASVGPIRLAPNADTTITIVVTCQLFESGIVYSRIRLGDWAYRIYRASPDGNNEFLLGNAWAHHYGATISPSGDLIAFTTIRHGLDGQALATLTPDGVRERIVAGGSGLPGYRRVSDPAWSPDGQRVVAVAGRDGEMDRYVIFDVDNGAATELEWAARGVMDWNRTSGRIALMRDDLGRSRIWVMDADGANGAWLSAPLENGMQDHAVAWSPDGQTVAVLRSARQGGAVSRLDLITAATGEARTLVTGADFLADRPAWSPDGTRLLAASYTAGYQSTQIEEIDVVTGARRIIVPGIPGSPARSPAWR